MELRRIVVYQRDVLSRLSRITNSQIGPELAIYYRDVWDHLSRVLDQSEQMRDELVGVMDAYLSQVSNRLNEIMKFLTAVSTLFIPLNFITGFFGMNFEFMPLLHSEWGFGLMLAVMIAVAWGSRTYFKRRGWL
jgi:magnesium transporter